MALSRAAAAAARKAAKSRGLQGNRGGDGSMLTSPTQLDRGEFKNLPLMLEEIEMLDDGSLNKAWLDTKQEIRELREMEGPESAELAAAQERLKFIENVMDERGMIDYELGIYDSDVDEYFGRYT